MLEDPDMKVDAFVQKDYDEDNLMKTIYFKPDSNDLETQKPKYVLYYACLTDIAINQTKIGNFLKDLHRVIRDNYDLDNFSSKTWIDKEFVSACFQVLDNYNMKPYDKNSGSGGGVVDFTKVRLAGKQVNDLKGVMIK